MSLITERARKVQRGKLVYIRTGNKFQWKVETNKIRLIYPSQ